ncbi:helix-turn-helix domain-containing protein [Paenibacillus sp. NEAU-GSW1]|uniref:helix-turn-helix domain-containing protein n=1 Tax=Paenibacillus sp. NEAU-GSW1 TaxID=2682486 RepID=UPI0012E109B6|nr:helix-turn-helix domain-containing protein [Paenibacillus sp. NEAU-GSW1]MUT66083.1 helix-turn-helix domain-containing protein [Paenibacillus sp. NEAU-GSW1]
MTLFHFTVPPMLHYIASGFTSGPPGYKHSNRRNIEVFVLLAVTEGCLYIGEEGQSFEIRPGQSLILRPDAHHYATKECEAFTSYHWLHFQTTGRFEMDDSCSTRTEQEELAEEQNSLAKRIFRTQTFIKQIPQFTTLLQPAKVTDLIGQLTELDRHNHRSSVSWKQQLLFQDIVDQLSASFEMHSSSPATHCAELAASYLRQHYRDPITAKELGESINFHPVYIARCMQRVFGCSPVDYLLRFRIERAKLLLLQTDHPIALIAEEVGFSHAAYFASTFTKHEGISPRKYRQRFCLTR